MKKRHLGLLVVALTSLNVLTACNNNNTNTDLVSFHTGYEEFKIDAVKPNERGKISNPNASKDGYKVLGYYTDTT